MGLSPAAEGRKDGRKDGEARLSWRGRPTAERVAQIAVTYRKVGVGRTIAPILKRGGVCSGGGVCRGGGGCIKRRWVSWYVTRLPQQPRSLRNRLWRSGRSRSGGGERQQLAGIHSQLFCVVMATAETQTFHRLRFNLKAKRCVENKPIKPCRNLQLTVLKLETIPLASKHRQH